MNTPTKPVEQKARELLACPFCAAGLARRTGWGTSFSGVEMMDPIDQPFVWCGSCGARTRSCDSQAEAVEAWNTRAALNTDEERIRREGVVETVSAEGTVQVLRSSATEPKRCICCAGPHCFAMRAEIEGAQDAWGRKLTDVRSFAENVLWKKVDGEPIYDGARFRVTVEVLSTPSKGVG